MKSESYYYLSKGLQDVFYTLWHTYIDFKYIDGTRHTYRKHSFIQNLSTDKSEAMTKASEYASQHNLPLHSEVSDTTHSRSTHAPSDPFILPAGKYAGKHLHEIQTSDPNYLIWLASEAWSDKSQYFQTAQAAKLLAKDLLEQKHQTQTLALQQTKAKIASAWPIISLLHQALINLSEWYQWGPKIILQPLQSHSLIPESKPYYASIEALLRNEGFLRQSDAKSLRRAEIEALFTPILKSNTPPQ